MKTPQPFRPEFGQQSVGLGCEWKPITGKDGRRMLKKPSSMRPRIRRKVGFLSVNLLFCVLAFSAEEYPQCCSLFPDEFMDFSGLQGDRNLDVFIPSPPSLSLLLGFGTPGAIGLRFEILSPSLDSIYSVLRC